MQIHGTQLKLLVRGLTLLKDGGELVYSTCSLNPIENEAVVYAALQKFQGRVTVCAPPPNLRALGLTYLPGLETWRVPDPTPTTDTTTNEVRFFDSLDSVPEALTKANGKKPAVAKTMFPPASGCPELQHCMLMLPHHNDAGGFFCVRLKRQIFPGDDTDILKEFEARAAADVEARAGAGCSTAANGAGGAPAASGAEPEAPAVCPASKASCVAGRAPGGGPDPEPEPLPLQIHKAMFKHDIVIKLMNGGDPDTDNLLQFYGVPPAAMHERLFLLTSPKGAGRKIAHLSAAAASMMNAFANSKAQLKDRQLQFASFGLRVFLKLKDGYLNTAPCRWRPCQEVRGRAGGKTALQTGCLQGGCCLPCAHALAVPREAGRGLQRTGGRLMRCGATTPALR